MDPLTHGLIGAGAAALLAPRDKLRAAAFCGMVGGLLPDADIYLPKGDDPLFIIRYHRHFTHAMAFAPIGGLVAACLSWLIGRKQLSFKLLYLFSFLGYLLHGLIDSCTSYGTHLFLPFTEARTAWNILAQIDPILTFTLLALVSYGLIRLQKPPLAKALLFLLLWIGFGEYQHQRARAALFELASERGYEVERAVVSPMLLTPMLWRAMALAEDHIYIDAIRPGIFGKPQIYPGDRVAYAHAEKRIASLPEGSVMRRDIATFHAFSGGFLGLVPEKEGLLADMRFSVLPYHPRPLWGILIDPASPDQHVRFHREPRNVTREDWRHFFEMLQGKPLS